MSTWLTRRLAYGWSPRWWTKWSVCVQCSLVKSSPVFQLGSLVKALDTFGNCQRPVFSFGVSQHMHKIINLWTFELIWSSKMEENNDRKKQSCRTSCLLSDAWNRDLCWGIEFSSHILVRNHIFLRNYVTSQGAVFTMLYTIHFSLPSKFSCQQLFWVITNSVQCL